MRKAINQNRTVQLALLGVLLLAGGFMLLTVTKGSGSQSTTTTASTASPAGTVAATSEPSTATAPTTDASAVSGGAAVSIPSNMVPGPGLPKGLLPAYDHGKAIVLFVRRAGGIDDGFVRNSVDSLRSEPQVKVYVTKAKQIARFSWLTQGVDVTELPALVVLRPKNLTDGTPTATVSYGFREAASVVQAVKDALYRGPTNRPYHP
jgi:hypothetical protein